MEHVSAILRRLLLLQVSVQIFSVEDEDGSQHFWNVSEGLRIAIAHGDLRLVSLPESGLTPEFVRDRYTDLDEAYAMTTDTTRPILFIPHRGKDQCIDGFHRLYKAAVLGQPEIPAWFLTQEQADAIRICSLPAGQHIDWGQTTRVA